MRLIDADVLLDNIRRDSKKAIDEGDKVGSFWLGYAAGLVIKQPTIQPVATDTNVGDTISRQAAIDALDKQIKQCCKALGSLSLSDVDKHAVEVEMASIRAYKEMLEYLPTVQPELTDIDAREAVYNLAEKIGIHQLFALTVELRGEPIQPEPHEGHWIRRDCGLDVECKCSKCGYRDFVEPGDEYWFKRNYCPNCGAKMTISK